MKNFAIVHRRDQRGTPLPVADPLPARGCALPAIGCALPAAGGPLPLPEPLPVAAACVVVPFAGTGMT
ncbi:MAG: hypothetical protein M3619_09725, partial [Myxococcota bacterium]|nr:hypothetical protein [Myxococcota bacterium]